MIIVLSCAHQTVFDRIEQGDFSLVIKGRYDRPSLFLDEGRQYYEDVHEIRAVIEKRHDILPLITRQYYQIDKELVFTYKYALMDTVNHYLVLRYFARVYDDPLLAGYQIFFAYSTTKKKIVEVYTEEVPLE